MMAVRSFWHSVKTRGRECFRWESVAARAEMNNLVRGQIDRPIEAPVADMLNQQVGDSMTAARQNRLTGMDQSRLDAAVAEAQGARGGAGPAADFAKPLTSGFAGEQRQQQATQGAMGFLSSGSSPEDIAYRRNQQNLANLSAEANRKTPQSQFSSLSGAQNGPTPIQTKAPLSVMPEGQAAGAQQAALSTWNTQMGQANSTVDPWLVGLTGAMQLGNTATSIVGQKRS